MSKNVDFDVGKRFSTSETCFSMSKFHGLREESLVPQLRQVTRRNFGIERALLISKSTFFFDIEVCVFRYRNLVVFDFEITALHRLLPVLASRHACGRASLVSLAKSSSPSSTFSPGGGVAGTNIESYTRSGEYRGLLLRGPQG